MNFYGFKIHYIYSHNYNIKITHVILLYMLISQRNNWTGWKLDLVGEKKHYPLLIKTIKDIKEEKKIT